MKNPRWDYLMARNKYKTGRMGRADAHGKLPVEPAYGAIVSTEPCSLDTPSPPAENSRNASPEPLSAPFRRFILPKGKTGLIRQCDCRISAGLRRVSFVP